MTITEAIPGTDIVLNSNTTTLIGIAWVAALDIADLHIADLDIAALDIASLLLSSTN